MAKNADYREAEKKIESARLSGAKKLNLRGKQVSDIGLSELPESLGQLTQLQTLNLSDNQLTALPESLGRLTQLRTLNLSFNQLTALPESMGRLTQLRTLNLTHNQLTALPESLDRLTGLRTLNLSYNQLTALPETLGRLTQLQLLDLAGLGLGVLPLFLGQLLRLRSLVVFATKLKGLPCWLVQLKQLEELNIGQNPLPEFPEWFGELTSLRKLVIYQQGSLRASLDILSRLPKLEALYLNDNGFKDLPPSFANLNKWKETQIEGNHFSPELAAAFKEGLGAVRRYLRAKAEAQVVLNEAKLILIGEGEVGKSCLLCALRGDPWEEGKPTTHGIEIKPVKVTDPATGTEITLNGWDFGGQRVYRPTHQLFFSAPAVYLVVWKPREGPQQGFVKEWIKLVKHREPDAKILVVATHGGPKERLPDIDRQEIWDLFGKETVIDFLTVDSRPDEKGERPTIAALKTAIARVANTLPEVGRTFPKHWQEARNTLRKSNEAYLPLDRVAAICKEHGIETEDSLLLLRICRRVGDLIHYEHDPLLQDIVVLKPDWLATAISFVLDDQETREESHGLVKFERLGKLWNDAGRPEENRYPAKLHPIFLRLMERFDLSYRIAEQAQTGMDGTSLIAQLVSDVRPENDLARAWPPSLSLGDEQQVQICRIVDTANNQSATAEGLFYQLIVRLHKYSLGRTNFCENVHWQRGLVLEDDTGARALLEHIANDVRITVRSPYPARFLSALTYETKWLVEDFWKGMRCEVTVPCLLLQPNGDRCKGLFEVAKLIESKGEGYPKFPCPVCNRWQVILDLLHNAPSAHPNPIEELLANFGEVKGTLEAVVRQLGTQHVELIGRFNQVDAGTRETISKVEAAYTGLMHTLLDEAKEGPKLFSFEPVEPSFLDRPKWVSAKFKLTLWCEHSRRPLWLYSEGNAGVYTIDLPRNWLMKAAPFLRVLSTTLGLVLPVVAAGAKATLPEADYKGIEAQLALGKTTAELLVKGGEEGGDWLAKDDGFEVEPGLAVRAEGGVLRQLHAWLKEKDPSFGGLVRVQNKRQEFLWVHTQFEKEY